MTLADDFDALTVQRVEEFIATAQEEHLLLEFKRLASPDLSAQSDKDNLAIALAGFANSAGGIVIWGVATKKHTTGKVEVAAAAVEISDLSIAIGRLNEFTGVLVTATVDGVRHKKLETHGNHGFIATIIPASDSGPHMALAGAHGYYKRNGDRFLPMEHFEIADMFGRRRRPALRVVTELSEGRRSTSFRDAHIDLVIENSGRGSAVAPYVDVYTAPGSNLSINPHGVSEGVDLMQPLWSKSHVLFIGRTDLVIHSGIRFNFARVVWRLETNHKDIPWRSAEIFCRYAADGLQLTEQAVTVPRAELASLLGFNAKYLFPND